MNQLKENAFAIALGAMGVAFLVLVYLWVWSPLSSVAARKQELSTTLNTLQAFDRSPKLPTADHIRAREDQEKEDRRAYEDAVAFFGEKAERFNLYFDDVHERHLPNIFAGMYQSRLGTLVDEYRRTHGIVPVEGVTADKLPPEVQQVSSDDIGRSPDESIPWAMKQFWVTQAVFEALDKLRAGGFQSGGLKKIGFGARVAVTGSAAARAAAATSESAFHNYGYLTVTVDIDLHYRALEPLLAALLRHPRVPFVEVEKLTLSRSPEVLKQYAEAVVASPTFQTREEAEAKSYDELVPEPLHQVSLSLKVLDWKGVKEQPAAEDKR
jgi:hypothetical protein